MSKQIRFIILIVSVVMFFSITPIIIGHSLGYRIDFDQKKIVATGGIYLRVWPSPAEVYIDSKPIMKTNIIYVKVIINPYGIVYNDSNYVM